MAAGNVVYISMYKHDKVNIYVKMLNVLSYKTYVDVEFKFMNSKWNRNQDGHQTPRYLSKIDRLNFS